MMMLILRRQMMSTMQKSKAEYWRRKIVGEIEMFELVMSLDLIRDL